MAAAVALCLGAAGLHSIVRDAGSIRALAHVGAAVRVEATVVSDPRTLAAATQRSGRDLVLVELDVAGEEVVVVLEDFDFDGIGDDEDDDDDNDGIGDDEDDDDDNDDD